MLLNQINELLFPFDVQTILTGPPTWPKAIMVELMHKNTMKIFAKNVSIMKFSSWKVNSKSPDLPQIFHNSNDFKAFYQILL